MCETSGEHGTEFLSISGIFWINVFFKREHWILINKVMKMEGFLFFFLLQNNYQIRHIELFSFSFSKIYLWQKICRTTCRETWRELCFRNLKKKYDVKILAIIQTKYLYIPHTCRYSVYQYLLLFLYNVCVYHTCIYKHIQLNASDLM